MKSLLAGLLIIAAASVARAASTDTISVVVYSDEAVETAVPIEQKVVEIHMTKSEVSLQQEISKNRKSKLPLPVDFGRGTCSGEFIGNEGEILTAKHCVTGFETFEVQTYDRRIYIATVIATSTAHDLAIIRIDRNDTPYFDLAKSVNRGESVSILGSPLGFTDTLSEGVVAKLEGDTVLLDCGALPGNSGGPVFNAKQELVGVLTAGYTVMLGVTHLNQAQSVDAVRFFIREVAQRYPNGRR